MLVFCWQDYLTIPCKIIIPLPDSCFYSYSYSCRLLRSRVCVCVCVCLARLSQLSCATSDFVSLHFAPFSFLSHIYTHSRTVFFTWVSRRSLLPIRGVRTSLGPITNTESGSNPPKKRSRKLRPKKKKKQNPKTSLPRTNISNPWVPDNPIWHWPHEAVRTEKKLDQAETRSGRACPAELLGAGNSPAGLPSHYSWLQA